MLAFFYFFTILVPLFSQNILFDLTYRLRIFFKIHKITDSIVRNLLIVVKLMEFYEAVKQVRDLVRYKPG